MSAEITVAAGPRGGLAGLVDRARVLRPLVKAAQLGLTGGYVRRLNGLLAADLRTGPHGFVLELGCGDAPLLDQFEPERYAGLDLNPRSLRAARRSHGREGVEFAEADISAISLEPWSEADAVVCSAVFHHLPDEQVGELVEKAFDQVGASRIVCTDGVMTGPLRGAITWLDEGEPTRPKPELYRLLGDHCRVEETWSFDVPFRTVHVFGFVLSRDGSALSPA